MTTPMKVLNDDDGVSQSKSISSPISGLSSPDSDLGCCESKSSIEVTDLYDGLEGEIFSRDDSAHISKLKEKLDVLLHETNSKSNEIRSLREENHILRKNISTLFLTAKSDVEKKQFLLKRLEKQLRELVNEKSKVLSKHEIEDMLESCSQAQREASSQLCIDEVKKQVDEYLATATVKPSSLKTTIKKWSKHVKFGNMSIYLHKEQIPFKRSCDVTFQPRSPCSNVNKIELTQSDLKPISCSNQNTNITPSSLLPRSDEDKPVADRISSRRGSHESHDDNRCRVFTDSQRRNSSPLNHDNASPYDSKAQRRKRSRSHSPVLRGGNCNKTRLVTEGHISFKDEVHCRPNRRHSIRERNRSYGRKDYKCTPPSSHRNRRSRTPEYNRAPRNSHGHKEGKFHNKYERTKSRCDGLSRYSSDDDYDYDSRHSRRRGRDN